MARKKTTGTNSSNMNQIQGGIITAVDQVVSGIEAQIVDHAETRLYDFVLGGGLADQLTARMLPHLEEFKNQVGSIPSSTNTLALGSGAIEAEVSDV